MPVELRAPDLETLGRKFIKSFPVIPLPIWRSSVEMHLSRALFSFVSSPHWSPSSMVGAITVRPRQISHRPTGRAPSWKCLLAYDWLLRDASNIGVRQRKNRMREYSGNILRNASYSACREMFPCPQALLPPWMSELMRSSHGGG